MKYQICGFDFESFKRDWLVVFKTKQGDRWVIHNDNDLFIRFMEDHNSFIFAGFNNKHYDNYLVKAIAYGASPEMVNEISRWIIDGNLPWKHYFLKGKFYKFPFIDVRDDMQDGLSLKAIEAHLGMDIRESDIPFDIDRPLTNEEIQSTIEYCTHDVDATLKILSIRKDYLQGKLNLADLRHIPKIEALSLTNAKLVAQFLCAEPVDRTDERDYALPNNLKLNRIPKEVLDFFGRIRDREIPDDELFKSHLKITIGGMETKYGFGGIHGSVSRMVVESEES